MPRRRTLPKRRRQAKTEALAKWRRAQGTPRGACSTVRPDGTRCTGRDERLGYCSDCWGSRSAH